jgi:hypothetical protein
MSLREKANFIIYRFAEKGLEVFMVKDDVDNTREWKFPEGSMLQPMDASKDGQDLIELEPLMKENGESVKAIALEGDWHDLPSITHKVQEDVTYVKDKIKDMMPDLNKGAYFAMKEAFKKVMPHEYALLKELKDILLDRNSTKDI